MKRHTRIARQKQPPRKRARKLPKSMDALQLKANCYAVLDQIAATGRSILITKDGKPLVRLRPHKSSTLSRASVP